MEYDAEIMLAFLEEIGGYLPQFRAHLTRLEVKSKDREALDECYRLAHTIKGTASTMGLNEISQQGLDMEQALLPVVEKKAPYTSDVGTILRTRLERVDHLLADMERRFQESAAAPEPAPLPPPPPIRPTVQEPARSFTPPPPPPAQFVESAPFEPLQPFSFEPSFGMQPFNPEPIEPFNLSSSSKASDAGFDLNFDFDEDLASLPGFADATPLVAPPPAPSTPVAPPSQPFKPAPAFNFDAPSEPIFNFDSLSEPVFNFEEDAPKPPAPLEVKPQNMPRAEPVHPLFAPLDYFDLGPEMEQQLASEQTASPPNQDNLDLDYLNQLMSSDNSAVSFDHFEPQLDDATRQATNLTDAELTDFVMPEWIDPETGSSPSVAPQAFHPQADFERASDNLPEMQGFSLNDLLSDPSLDDQIAQLQSQNPPEFSGFVGEPLASDIPTGEVNLLKPYGRAGHPASLDLDNFDDSLGEINYRGDLGGQPAFNLGDTPDDFTDAADLLAQFDNDPGMLLSEEIFSGPDKTISAAPSPVWPTSFEFEPEPEMEATPELPDAQVVYPEMQVFEAITLPEPGDEVPFDLSASPLNNFESPTFAAAPERKQTGPLPDFDFDFDFAGDNLSPDTTFSPESIFDPETEIQTMPPVKQLEASATSPEPFSFEDLPDLPEFAALSDLAESETEVPALPFEDLPDLPEFTHLVDAELTPPEAVTPVELESVEIPGFEAQAPETAETVTLPEESDFNLDEVAAFAVEAEAKPLEQAAPEIPAFEEDAFAVEAPLSEDFLEGLTPEEVAALAELQAGTSGEDEADFGGEADFDMGALWLAEGQSDIDRLKTLIADFGESGESEADARKIKEIATRLRKGADMMDLEPIARQLGVIEIASDAILEGELRPYMSGGDIFSYEMAALMVILAPYEEGARDYMNNVEAEQAAALAATAPRPAPAVTKEADEEEETGEAEFELPEPAIAVTAATVAPATFVTASASPPPGIEVDEELAMVFASEAEEHIQNLDTRLAQLERNPNSRELLREIRRTAHTLKGSAAMVGFNVISQTAHLMEDLLDRLFDGSMAVTEDVVQLLFITFNAIDNMVRGLGSGKPEDVSRLDILRPRYAELLSGQAPEEQGAGGIIIFEKKDWAVPASIRSGNTRELEVPISRTFSEEEVAAIEAAQAQQVAQEQAELLGATSVPSMVPIPGGVTLPASGTVTEAEIAVRVPIKRLDGMMNQVGELVINRTVLERRNQILARTAEELLLSIKRLQRVSRELETRYEVELLKNSAAPLMSAATPYRTGSNGSGLSNGNGSDFPYGQDYTRPRNNDEFDSLEMDQYTEFHTLSREMSETVADLAAAQRELDNLRSDLENATIGQSRITDDLQDKLVKVRLIPISNLTPRLYRTVRTLAAQQNKEIEFVVSGENTQVDKTIFEEIGDPLLHMIRNAVDHGVESPEVRVQQGKPPKATITFLARNEGSQVVIEVRDDGTGISPEEIRRRAVEKGFIKADAVLSRDEIFDLIFLPGFSTSVTISEISGRGVGMDVVRASILKLKGSIETQSEIGKGTVFIIRLPTTLAITRALLVRANGYSYAIPLNVIEQTTKFEADLVDDYGSRAFYKLDGANVPLLELGQILRLPEHAQRGPDPEDEDKPDTRREQPLLVITGAERAVLRVDKLLGQQEVVVKSLGTHMKYVPGVIGATTLGSGEVILILNIYDLIDQAIGKRNRVSASTAAGVATGGRAAWQRVRNEVRARRGMTTTLGGSPPRQAERRTPLIQVVDDSLSMRKVLSSALEKANYRVRTSKDGQEALETIQQSAPDLIIMDIEMPRMDGYELTSILKGRESFYNIPIVMLTSRAGLKHRQKAEEVGADGFLVKPYKEEELLQIVATLLERARL